MNRSQKGFSLIELLIVVAIILIIAAIAIPNLLRAKIAANEASAVGSTRTIVTAEISYSKSFQVGPTLLTNLQTPAGGCPAGGATTAAMAYSSTYGNGFPPSLIALGGVPGAAATCDQANLLDPIISTAPYTKSGFAFSFTAVGATVTPVPGCSNPGTNAYLVTATPTTEDLTGIRSFCSDEPGTIHYDTTGATAGTQNACEALPALQ